MSVKELIKDLAEITNSTIEDRGYSTTNGDYYFTGLPNAFSFSDFKEKYNKLMFVGSIKHGRDIFGQDNSTEVFVLDNCILRCHLMINDGGNDSIDSILELKTFKYDCDEPTNQSVITAAIVMVKTAIREEIVKRERELEGLGTITKGLISKEDLSLERLAIEDISRINRRYEKIIITK
jgi:hypothetical protein